MSKREPKVNAENPQSLRLYSAMLEKGYSVNKLSSEAGLSKATVRNFLRGDAMTGCLYSWGLIADALDISLDWLCRGDG